jgi:dTDP-4-amino-4,6-dideoxygalactose transaminase
MVLKNSIGELAIFGGVSLFATSKSTSNLLRPDFNQFLSYSKLFFDQQQYTNNGPNVKLLEQRLAEFHQTEFCVSFCSGFWALALTIFALAIKGKTEIVMPSLTYRRMDDIAAWVNLRPSFCEIEQTTLAMSAATVRPCINPNTALILAVHPIVNCCDVEGLLALAKETNIPLLFDSVESVYEFTAGGKVGNFGNAEAFSLHACKLMNGFGGGYITTNDGKLAKRLAALRTFGFTGEDSVTMTGGMNAKLNEIHAAMALASLDNLEEQILLNRDRYYTYKRLLAAIPEIRLVEFDEDVHPGFKNIVVELLDKWPLPRADTLEILNAEEILARAHYFPPLHRKPINSSYAGTELPLTDKFSKKFVNLPCGQLVDNDDIDKIVEMLNFICTNADMIANRLRQESLLEK